MGNLAPPRSGVRPGADLALAKRQTSLDVRNSMAREELAGMACGFAVCFVGAGTDAAPWLPPPPERDRTARAPSFGNYGNRFQRHGGGFREGLSRFAGALALEAAVHFGNYGNRLQRRGRSFGKNGRVFTALLRTADGNFAHYAKRSQSDRGAFGKHCSVSPPFSESRSRVLQITQRRLRMASGSFGKHCRVSLRD
jgi:hypothetical protein